MPAGEINDAKRVPCGARYALNKLKLVVWGIESGARRRCSVVRYALNKLKLVVWGIELSACRGCGDG